MTKITILEQEFASSEEGNERMDKLAQAIYKKKFSGRIGLDTKFLEGKKVKMRLWVSKKPDFDIKELVKNLNEQI